MSFAHGCPCSLRFPLVTVDKGIAIANNELVVAMVNVGLNVEAPERVSLKVQVTL